jgi:hypothetical protein
MFDFDIDNSNYFDFATKNKKDIFIRQDAQIPLIEIFPIQTENFSKLLEYIKNASVTFSMYDNSDFYKILDKAAIVNLNTKANKLNDKTDSCKDILDFSLQYIFSEKDLSVSGTYRGEFKINFLKDKEDKILIVPIHFPLKITIFKSSDIFKTKTESL